MKGSPLRRAYLAATLALLGALAWAQPAATHVDIRPGLLETGSVTPLRIELPRLRAGAPPSELELEGAGLEVLSSRLAGSSGADTVWLVRVRAAGPPRSAPIVLRARFAGGASVDVEEALTVVPGTSTPFPWAGVTAGGALAIGFAVVALVLARRRPRLSA